MNMKRIRQGNDFLVTWRIKRAGINEDLNQAVNMSLVASVKSDGLIHSKIVPFDIVDNSIVRIEVTPEIAQWEGIYNFVLKYEFVNPTYLDNNEKCAVDKNIFIIVPRTSLADEVALIECESDVLIGLKGKKGDSAFTVWNKENGGNNTYDDWLAFLQSPATEIEGIVSANEAIRVENENTRKLNEIERKQSEETRHQNESARVTAEIDREENEDTRSLNEATRLTNEDDRIANENQRVIDEGKREQLYDNTVILKGEVETLKTETETEKDNAITATNQINTVVIPNAETAIQNAIDVKNDYETVVKPDMIAKANYAQEQGDYAKEKGDLADTARLAIQDDLELKANQTDLAQLAGDVSELELKDVVQSDKIKDIENVISTMNPNQSAQLSVSGVSPLSLPKNAANGGMGVKMEGLTEDVGGVITHFEPTGRVRSVGKNIIPVETLREQVQAGVTLVNYKGRDCLTYRLAASSTNIRFLQGAFEQNTQYTISGYFERTLRNQYLLVISYTDGTRTAITTLTAGNFVYVSVTSTAGKTIDCLAGIEAGAQTVWFDINSFQIEKGSTATTYEPYKETNLYLTAPELRSNGTVKDEIRKGANGYELVQRINPADGTVRTTPVITPISYGGVLNSAENGTVYHEQVIADAGVYDTKMDILLTDYPIATIEEIIKHENGIDTYLNVDTAVIASDGLSFTHPDLGNGDLVLFTYAFDKESTNGNITATFYDSNVIKIDTVTGKAYRINEVVTNGVLTRTLTEV